VIILTDPVIASKFVYHCHAVDHQDKGSALLTNFRLIKPGALHRANGGYLLLDARSVLTEPFSWAALKRTLRALRAYDYVHRRAFNLNSD
jgi:hypothetical protein